MTKLTILIGVSCSGKSTWAKTITEKTFRVSRDNERISLFGHYRQGTAKEESVITNIVKEKITSLLAKKFDVILDNTHLKWDYIRQAIHDYNYLADIEFKIFNAPGKDEIMRRNQNRGDHTGIFIPETVIDAQLRDFKALMEQYKDKLVPMPQVRAQPPKLAYDDLEDCYIIDLDGTMALLDRSPYDPTIEEVANDQCNVPVVNVINSIFKRSAKLVFVSGRTDKYYEVSRNWIVNRLTDASLDDVELYMRKTGDQRSDVQIKKEIYEEHIRGRYRVLGAFDDRSCIVDLWKSLGVFVFDVSQGKGRF